MYFSYLPYGLMCIGLAFVCFYAFRKSLGNKRINRANRNKARLAETLLALRKAKEKSKI